MNNINLEEPVSSLKQMEKTSNFEICMCLEKYCIYSIEMCGMINIFTEFSKVHEMKFALVIVINPVSDTC